MDELKSNSQGFSRQAEKEKKEPVIKTVGADSAVEQAKAASASDIVKQVNPKRSMVESVISSMANSGASGNKQEKDRPKSNLVKTEEERPKNRDVGELRNLVGRISKTIPEKEFSPIAAKREEILDKEELPEPNIEPGNKKAEEKINREINSEIERRINEETERKIKRIGNDSQ